MWDRFVTGAPRPRTRSEQQYSDCKQVILVPPEETWRMSDRNHVFQQITDLFDPATIAVRPDLQTLRVFDVSLVPGDMLFVPVGWWHQVAALDFAVSATYTNFRWPNDWSQGIK